MSRSPELNQSISLRSQKKGALRVFDLLQAGISSPYVVEMAMTNGEIGRQSELNAIRVLSTLAYVSYIQDQPKLSDKYMTRKVDLLVHLVGKRKKSVYVQVKSSQWMVDTFIEETMTIHGIKTVGKAVRQLHKERIILLNANENLSDKSIILDFEQQLYDIERT